MSKLKKSIKNFQRTDLPMGRSISQSQKNSVFLVYLMSVSFIFSGCASMGEQLKALLGGSEIQTEKGLEPTKFSDTKNTQTAPREYERMTSERMKKEAGLGEKTGSLWAMEGQGAYLFAQNTSHVLGDILAINMDGLPKKQLEAKTKGIKDLLDQFEKQNSVGLQAAQDGVPAGAPAPPAAVATPEKDLRAPASAEGVVPEGLFKVDVVSARVVEKMKDGNYRVEGEQTFMIGPREYKLMLGGLVRPEDFTENGLSSEKLIDPRFDIVSR